MKQKRDSLTAVSRNRLSLMIGKAVRKLDLYRRAKTVMFYVNIGSEVETEGMIKAALKGKKKVVVPFIGKEGAMMGAARITSFGRDLKKGAYGIPEPVRGLRNKVSQQDIDIVVVPAVACDKACHRLGYGKGYYDRWLKKIPVASRIGLNFDSQVVEILPSTSKDLPLGMVVTEKRVLFPEIDRLSERSNK